MRLIVVSGLSGAGKSVAMEALEDLGYYCVDNLPTKLLPAFSDELADASGSAYERAAVAIDARNPADALQRSPAMIVQLRNKGVVNELLFVEAEDGILIKRFNETRRKHPLTAGDVSLGEAIRKERELLGPLRREADICIDTSRTNLHQLRDIIRERVDGRPLEVLSLLFESFGYKHGLPTDSDMVFDVRCLPNPHWEPNLRAHTGRDREVVEFLESQTVVEEMFLDIRDFLESWIPKYEAGNRSYLTIAIGCTGGQHRSVYLAERLAEHFCSRRKAVMIRHREIV